MAAGLLKHALFAEPEPLKSLNVDSFGLAASTGSTAAENAVFVMNRVGIDISNHQSKSIFDVDLDRALLVLCMAQSHRHLLLDHVAMDADKVLLFRDLVDKQDIEDPFGMDVRQYAHCRDLMLEAIPSLVEFVRSEVT
jgi:protein-tyrosine phosphatase